MLALEIRRRTIFEASLTVLAVVVTALTTFRTTCLNLLRIHGCSVNGDVYGHGRGQLLLATSGLVVLRLYETRSRIPQRIPLLP